MSNIKDAAIDQLNAENEHPLTPEKGLRLIHMLAEVGSLDAMHKHGPSRDTFGKIYTIAHTILMPECRKNHPQWALEIRAMYNQNVRHLTSDDDVRYEKPKLHPVPSDLTPEQIAEIVLDLEKAIGEAKKFSNVATAIRLTRAHNAISQLQEENAALREDTTQWCNSCDISLPDKRSYIDHVKVEHPC